MIEINLQKLDRGTHEGIVTVRRGGKVFQRKQKLGTKDKPKPAQETPQKDESFKNIKNYNNSNDFMRANVKELKAHGVKDQQGWEKIYNETRMERFTPKDLTREKAEGAICDAIRGSHLEGWFRAADPAYKIHVYNGLLNNDDARNGAYKLMQETYNIQNDTNIPFDEFLHTDIKLWRGGDMTDDIFTSFTMSKKIAEKFTKEYKAGELTEITVKPIDILGMCQPTGEAEVLVPKDVLESKLNKAEETKETSKLSFDKYLASLRYPDDKKSD